MILKRISFLLLSLTLLLLPLLVTSQVSAKGREVPEENGVYDDPLHPGVKVKVFVYKAKPDSGINQPASLVCNLADNNSSTVDGVTGWKLPNSWSYNLNLASAPSGVGSSNFETLATRSFNTWGSQLTGKVSLTRSNNTFVDRQAYDGVNVVAWGRTSGSALAVTYTRYYTSTGQVVDIDTIFNKKFVWSWTDQTQDSNCAMSNSYDAQNILTHELGHWMGLDDRYTTEFVNNTMYGYGSKAEVKKNTLTTGDISALNLIY